MSKKNNYGLPPRHGKTLKMTIEELLSDLPYKYYEDSTYKNFRNEIKNKTVNCSDKAPHQEEIDYLESLGLSYPVIRRILEHRYYANIQEISK